MKAALPARRACFVRSRTVPWSRGGSNGGTSALIQRFNYDYNGDLVTGVRREDGKWLYGYDTAGQVTAARKEFINGSGVPTGESYGGTKVSYAYDLMGNRTSSSEYGGGVSSAVSLRKRTSS